MSSEPLPTSPPAAPPAPLPEAPVLRDPLGARAFPLTGWLERQRFHPLLAAFLVFVAAFLVYQVVGAVVMVVLVVVELQAAGTVPEVGELMTMLNEHTAAILTGNALGQVAGFLVFVLLVTRLHTPAPAPFLRLRRPDGVQLALAAAGLVVLLPFVSWLGGLNQQVPLPESLEAFEEQQAALIERVLSGELDVVLGLLLLALTPAICEEVMFRGYLQRQVERRFGVVWSVVLVGVLFGLFHLRLTQALPLTALGLFLGFVVWASGSLWSGVLVHLLNNGLAVVVSDALRRHPDYDPVALEQVEVPGYLALLSLLLGLAACRLLLRRRAALLASSPAPPPAVPSPPASPLPPYE